MNWLIREIITFFTTQKSNRVVFVRESFSGSNSYALWKLANQEIHNKYEIILYQDGITNDIVSLIKKQRLLASAKLIVTTHASYKPSRNHIHLQLWHGSSIKKMGVMGLQNKSAKFLPPWKKVDYIMSYSETYNTFLNACMITDPRKYIITGASRNDFLFHSNGFSNLSKIFDKSICDFKLIFFIPTYREDKIAKKGCRNYNNPFGFDEFLAKDFDNFLKKNNCKLIFKPHPHEEALVLDYLNNFPLENMYILRNTDLGKYNLDLYELLNTADILITDYSSVFDDFLLLDRPIIFSPVDIDFYNKIRGFCIESYEDWTPGPKVLNQCKLQETISRCLIEKDYYKKEREMMRNLLHRYKDGLASQRLWGFIDSILDK